MKNLSAEQVARRTIIVKQQIHDMLSEHGKEKIFTMREIIFSILLFGCIIVFFVSIF